MTITREEWLERALAAVRPLFTFNALELPERVHVSVGFPSRNATSSKKRRIGECWDDSCGADGAPHVFVSPLLSDPKEILGVLVHELVHVAVGCKAGHRAPFQKAASKVGLEGPWTATGIGPALDTELDRILGTLPPLEHTPITPKTREKQQKNRHRLYACEACGQKIRSASDDLQATHTPCEAPFILQGNTEEGE